MSRVRVSLVHITNEWRKCKFMQLENNLQIMVQSLKWWPQCKQAHLKKNIEYLQLLEITWKLWTCLFLCTQWQLQQGRTQSIEAKITGAGFLAKPYVGIEENWQHTVMLNTRPPWETFSINLALIARLFELACSHMDHPCHNNHASLGENKAEIVHLCLSSPIHSSKFELLQAAGLS